MRILLVTTAYNGLCQRAHIELDDRGHEVSVALALGEAEIRKAVALFQPHLIVCPFLKEKVPADIFEKTLCIILHPGIQGDRGASSLDWAIMNEEREWGATALQAAEEMDAGDIWATGVFPMREASKASLYRREVTRVAIAAMLETITRIEQGEFRPEPLNDDDPNVRGRLRPTMQQADRAIHWRRDNVATILRKIHAGDSAPGVLDDIDGEEFYLFGAHEEGRLRGAFPGEIIAQRHGAICRAAIDGAVWITHLKKKNVVKQPFLTRLLSGHKDFDFKLPATMLLGEAVNDAPESPIEPLHQDAAKTFKEIWYEESAEVGYLHFDFHNGAMSTQQCQRLREAYLLAAARPIKVLVLMGGGDFWSNGIHLNTIEAAQNPADESWRNINAIDDVVFEIIDTMHILTVAAVWGGAGAGGAIMPLAADEVWAREGVVMNPHYKSMGLYGSEYWTYLLPRRVGPGMALELTEQPLPIGGMRKAKSIGMVDRLLPDDWDAYRAALREQAQALAQGADYDRRLREKRERRAADEATKPLASYRAAELNRMRINFYGRFYGGDTSYHEARHAFVHKIRPKQTAAHLAKHAQLDFSRLGELRQPLTY